MSPGGWRTANTAWKESSATGDHRRSLNPKEKETGKNAWNTRRKFLYGKDGSYMAISNDAVIRFGAYEGKAELEYFEDEQRFVVRKAASTSGASIVAGMMFGILGRMVAEGFSSGKEVGFFYAADITRVKTSTAKKKIIYYLYPKDGGSPYEITMELDCYLNTVMKRLFADRMEDIVAKDGTGKAAPKMATAPQPPVTPAQIPQPPVQPFAPPVQQAPQSVAPPAQPYQPPVQDAFPSFAPPVPRSPQKESPTISLSPQQSAAEEIPATAPVIHQPPARPANALLCLRTGPMAGNNYQCAPGRSVILGRDPSRCSLVLSQYPSVSALHCRIDIGDQFVMVTDLNSSNGTFVNGTRLQPGQSVPVRAGGAVKLATDACTFLIYFEK